MRKYRLAHRQRRLLLRRFLGSPDLKYQHQEQNSHSWSRLNILHTNRTAGRLRRPLLNRQNLRSSRYSSMVCRPRRPPER